jgi:sterol desaturase/sphingolipid hydroxylase (fatty acid hydroxylase superfamily)
MLSRDGEIGSFHQKTKYPLNLDILYFPENLRTCLSSAETLFLRYILNVLTSIRDIESSKNEKFSQNKIFKITCINNVLSLLLLLLLLLLKALQLYLNFGVFNYPFPFISILCEFLPVLDLHRFYVVPDVFLPP